MFLGPLFHLRHCEFREGRFEYRILWVVIDILVGLVLLCTKQSISGLLLTHITYIQDLVLRVFGPLFQLGLPA